MQRHNRFEMTGRLNDPVRWNGYRFGLPALIMLVGAARLPAQNESTISDARIEAHQVRTHAVTSPYQAGETTIRVLLPDDLRPNEKLPVLYVLPVEAKAASRWGDPIAEVVKHDLHNVHRMIYVFPTFSALPWYADHPTDPEIRQESYFIKIVLPFMERTYPAKREKAGRLLVGFSKSGYGAYSLLLRHPKLFAKAAAWDAPLMTAQPVKYGMEPIFGTDENFQQYRITKLLRERAKHFSAEPRLILTGHGGFKQEHDAAHRLMDQLRVSHTYREGRNREHSWNSGWLAEAVELLTSQPEDR